MLGECVGPDVGARDVQARSHSASLTGLTKLSIGVDSVVLKSGARRSPSASESSFSYRRDPSGGE